MDEARVYGHGEFEDFDLQDPRTTAVFVVAAGVVLLLLICTSRRLRRTLSPIAALRRPARRR
jgi:hypothetical protein